MNRLIDALQTALEEERLLSSNTRILCAVSGGADSMALLHAAHALQKQTGFSLHAIHVQHGLRGEASLADEAFVRAACQSLSIPLIVEDAGLIGSMDDPGMETRAREARQQLFAKHMLALDGHVLLTAHHRDDQTETVLMHLLRGSGMNGLGGIPRRTAFAGGVLLRPFLEIPKTELLEALQKAGLPHREDESNFQPVTPRNALRLEILPKLEELFPGAGAHIAQFAQLARADGHYLDGEAADLCRSALYDTPPIFALRRETLLAAEPVLRSRALRRWVAQGMLKAGLEPDERSLSYAATMALMHALEAGETLNLPCGLQALCGRTHIHLLHQDGSALLSAPSSQPVELQPGCADYHLPHLSIHQEQIPSGSPPPRSADSILLSPSILRLKPVLRTPLPGDVIRPFGAPGAKPLRRYLTDVKLDPPFRPVLTVLAAGSEVLWIPSLCASESLRLAAAPKGAIQLTLTQPVPFLLKPSKE